MSWNDIGIDETNYRSISPLTRSYGIGTYVTHTMLNLSAFRNSNQLAGTTGQWWANSGTTASASVTQVSTLDTRPHIFLDSHSAAFFSTSSAGQFVNQNSSEAYSIFRLTSDADIISDIAQGNSGFLMILDYSTGWDDQLFAVNGQEKGNTTNGSPLSKVVLPANYTDFSTSRPLLMSLVNGLPRYGGDTVSKSEPIDAYWRAGDFDYYLNYYSKYDGTSRKLLAKDDGMDWRSLNVRPQIDGTRSLSAIAADAASAQTGYSKVCKIAYI